MSHADTITPDEQLAEYDAERAHLDALRSSLTAPHDRREP